MKRHVGTGSLFVVMGDVGQVAHADFERSSLHSDCLCVPTAQGGQFKRVGLSDYSTCLLTSVSGG
jgi:hypothetical protein